MTAGAEFAGAAGAINTGTVVAVGARPKLTIVIPALDEEKSIASIIGRCLEARPEILQRGCLRDVAIIVVNDGSSDRTSEIAHEIAERETGVSVIDFKVNRGYGAALKEGFRRGDGELVSFLDADGTCDPGYFAQMCYTIQAETADVVLGSRMGPGSQMPGQRRLGNRLFALLLGFLSGQAVSDTASGMRVIRRDSLAKLYPLPDGLQFTPAMSARAILDGMKIVEIDMSYSERVGESKLHVFRDGLRFLAAIFGALLLFRPNRLFNLAAAISLLVAVAWAMYPTEFYFREGRLEEEMIYRILLGSFLLTCSFGFAACGVLANQVRCLVHERASVRFFEAAMDYLFAPAKLCVLALAGTIVSISLVWPGLVEYIGSRQTSLHWSRAIVAVFLMEIAVGAAVTALLQWVIRLWRVEVRSAEKEEDRNGPPF